MKRIMDIVRTDFITMNGGKNEIRTLAILMSAMIVAGVFFASPLVSLYFPFLFSVFFVQMIFKNEMKYNCEKMYSILPIERKDLVNARYSYCCILFFGCNFIIYLLMQLSQKVQLFVKFTSGGQEEIDIVKLVAEKTHSGLTEFGFLTLCYTVTFHIGLSIMTFQLKRYFKAGAKTTSEAMKLTGKTVKLTKEEKRESFRSVTFLLGGLFLFIGILNGWIPVGQTLSIILSLLGKLAQLGNGLLFSAVIFIVSVMQALLNYFKTQIIYEKRDI